jgi:PAS domain S-box-containing protein
MYAVGRDATEKKEAEKKSEENLKLLREAEELQSSILNSLPAQVALLNEEGVIVAVNKTWKDFATENNLQRADYGVGENYISVSASAFGPDLQAGSKIAIAIREVIAGKLGGFSLEYPCHTPFEKRWYHVRIAPTRDGANKGAVIIHTNITTRKIAEEKVIRSETNLTAIIENTDAYIYSLDANLRFVNFNSQSAKYLNSLLGLEIKQGDSVTELFEKAGSKENTFWKEKYALALAGKAQSFESDYSKPGMPRYLSFSINPISENGKVIGLSCHGRDITASKTAQIELKELTKRLQLAIKSAALGIWDWDIIKNHLSWDAGMYRIYEINEVQFGSVYDGWLSRIHPDDRERVNEEIQMAIQGEKAYNTEFRIIWNDLAIRYIKATGIVERDADARAVRMIGANWDITQNKETEFKIKELNNVLEQQVEKRTAQLSQANKDLEAYTATVSHDLRAPARAVAQFATIFRENYGGRMEPKEKELFQYIEDNGRRMTAIIDDLLKLAKYGNEKLTIEEVDMTRLVQGIWQDISRSELHRAELELQQLADIEADESMMQQVLINLLSNAIKYSSKREKPLVSVWCQRQEKYISFYFKDNGAGFDMKHYDRLFGAFQRFHNQRDFAGTGVGLTLVKRIIEKHGGTVGAESKVDEGATFYFTLPVARIKISDGL